METSSKKLMEALPSFDEFMNIASKIKELSVRKMQLENRIKETESNSFKEVMSNPKYYINGKPVAVSFFENAFKFTGLDGGLILLRNELAQIQSELDEQRNLFDIYKQMHDLFKVLVYQERVFS
jgi:hypothetical protein